MSSDGNGWKPTPLSELLEPVSRSVSVEPHVEYTLLGARWYAKGLYQKDRKLGSEIKASKLYRVEQNDFVYNRLFAWKGSFAVATDDNDGCFVSNEFPCFTVQPDRLDPRFLWYYFSREASWNEALGLSHGATPTSRNRLKEKHFLRLKVPLPLLGEQQSIVARIDRLAAKIEEAKLLSLQSRGASDALHSSALADCFDESVPREPLADLVASDSRISYGVLVPGPDVEDGIPFVRVQDLDTQSPAETPAKRIAPEIEAAYARTRLSGGEILIGVVGSIGKIGIAPESWRGANIARAVCRIVPGPRIDRDFLTLVLQASTTQRYFQDVTRTLAQPTLNVAQLSETLIPVPSLDEQRQVVSTFHGIRSKTDDLQNQQKLVSAELNALLPSILDRAFKGEL